MANPDGGYNLNQRYEIRNPKSHEAEPLYLVAAKYPEAFKTSQKGKVIPHDGKLRRVKYLNNIIEQYHRFFKKRVRASLGCRTIDTAERTLQGVEAVNMIRKGQVKRLDRSDVIGQTKFVGSLFYVAA
jgi:transposase-like protein